MGPADYEHNGDAEDRVVRGVSLASRSSQLLQSADAADAASDAESRR